MLHQAGVAHNVEIVVIVVLVVDMVESLLLLARSPTGLRTRSMGVLVPEIRLHFGISWILHLWVLIIILVCNLSMGPVSLSNSGGRIVVFFMLKVLIANLSCVHVSLRL